MIWRHRGLKVYGAAIGALAAACLACSAVQQEPMPGSAHAWVEVTDVRAAEPDSGIVIELAHDGVRRLRGVRLPENETARERALELVRVACRSGVKLAPPGRDWILVRPCFHDDRCATEVQSSTLPRVMELRELLVAIGAVTHVDDAGQADERCRLEFSRAAGESAGWVKSPSGLSPLDRSVFPPRDESYPASQGWLHSSILHSMNVMTVASVDDITQASRRALLPDVRRRLSPQVSAECMDVPREPWVEPEP